MNVRFLSNKKINKRCKITIKYSNKHSNKAKKYLKTKKNS